MFDIWRVVRACASTPIPRALAVSAAALVLLGSSVGPARASAGDAETVVFAYTGGEQVYTVPAGVTLVHVAAIGGAGAAGASSSGGSATGGLGADVHGDVSVTPGEQLFLEVGGSPSQPGSGGFNGGGDSRNGGGGGGGASDVRTCSRTDSSCATGNDTLTSRILVAAGGGGGGSSDAPGRHPGGSGGSAGSAGMWGTPPPFSSQQGGPGDPGSTSAGGGVGQENNVAAAGSPGVFGAGGAASTASGQGGGGGGGGWFGGAAGGTSTDGSPAGGGGGGSSYAASSARNVTIQVATAAVPSIAITPLTPTAQLSARILTFPQTPVGSASGVQTETIANSGQAPLSISGVAIHGPNAGDFAIVSTTCAGAISPRANCQILARFSPLAIGKRKASLVVWSAGLARQVVALTATATAPTLPLFGTEACTRRPKARACSVSLSASALGLTRRSHVKSFTLRRSRTIVRGTVSVRGVTVQLHSRKPVAPGRYLLTVWTTHDKRQQLLRQIPVQVQ